MLFDSAFSQLKLILRFPLPRHFRLRRGNSRMSKKTEKTARRSPKIWSAEATSAFLRYTVEAYEAAGLNKKDVHKKITLALNALLQGVPNESEISEEQVRHKYEGFKKQWVQWQGLCNKIGAGWDPVKGTVTGTNEWWSDRVKGNHAEAIACYNEVLRIDPLAADGLVNRGNTLKEIGRVNEAIQGYIRAVFT